MAKSSGGILIVTVEDDLHALVVQREIQDRHGLRCHVIESDKLPGQGVLSWSSDGSVASTLPTRGNGPVDVSSLAAVWWRRFAQPLKVPTRVGAIARDIITNDCRNSIEGLLVNEFRGAWINSPEATRAAENKLIQLRAAQRAGFRVPRTLVSQDPVAIRHFCGELGYNAIVKAVRGTTRTALLTLKVDKRFLDAPHTILSLAPAMYQEMIDGTQHIRANCFGENIYAARIDSTALDWRANLSVPFTSIKLADDVNARLLDALRDLGLRMGIVDLKVTPAGELVWLEVNPQGQFLFIEALTGLGLAAAFSEFLCREAIRFCCPPQKIRTR